MTASSPVELCKRWCNAAKSHLSNLTGTLLLFIYAFLTYILTGYFTWSCAWFLQVVHRVTTGDVLYRDVFFGPLPLSIYVTAALASLFGPELLVMKAIVALCFALICRLSYRIAQQLGLDRIWSLLVLVGILALFPPWRPGVGVYTALAYVSLMGSLSAILSWQRNALAETCTTRNTGRTALVVAGICAGLSCGSKQNVGVFALFAICLALAVSLYKTGISRHQLLRVYALVLSVFSLTVAFILLPVWLSGGIERFIDYGLLSMGTYARVSGISYLAQLNLLLDLLVSLAGDPKPWGHAAPISWQLQFLLPFPACAVLAWLWLRSPSDKRRLITILLLFSGAAFAGVFPRVDIGHTIYTVPIFMIGLVWACYQITDQFSRHWRSTTRAVFLLCAVTAFGFNLIANVLWIIPRAGAEPRQFSYFPHFRGVLMHDDYMEEVHSQAQMLKQITGGQPTFILNPSAGFYYLLTGLKNPTPYDFPLAGAFGCNGEAEVISDIQRQRIQYVCMSVLGSHPLAPTLLEGYVQEHMEPIHDIGFCTLYRKRP